VRLKLRRPYEDDRTASRSRRHRGAALGLIGIVHVAATAAFYPDSVASVVQGGVVAAVEADPELVPLRGLAFWYVTSGLGVIALGVTVADLERRNLLRLHHGALLGAIGVWGVLFVPKSGFWLFLLLAALAAVRRGTARPAAGAAGAALEPERGAGDERP
jgi:hypothetical protein